jgi:hypothetical protein
MMVEFRLLDEQPSYDWTVSGMNELCRRVKIADKDRDIGLAVSKREMSRVKRRLYTRPVGTALGWQVVSIFGTGTYL